MKIDIKKLVGVVAVGGIVIMLIISQVGKNKEQPRTEIMPTVVPHPTSQDDYQSPSKIEWKVNSLEIPEKADEMMVTAVEISDNRAKEMAKAVGVEADGKKIANQPIILFVDSEGAKSFYVDPKDGVVEYSRDILSRPLAKPTNKKTVAELKDQLALLMNTWWGMSPDDWEIDQINYKKILGPRFVETDEKSAEVTELLVNYKYQSWPVIIPQGSPVRAVFSQAGEVVSIKMQIPFQIGRKIKEVKVKQLADLKTSKAGDFRIFNVNGGQDYDRLLEKAIIGQTTIVGGDLKYVYSPNDSRLIPYVVFTGNSQLETGPATVVLGVAAEKS